MSFSILVSECFQRTHYQTIDPFTGGKHVHVPTYNSIMISIEENIAWSEKIIIIGFFFHSEFFVAVVAFPFLSSQDKKRHNSKLLLVIFRSCRFILLGCHLVEEHITSVRRHLVLCAYYAIFPAEKSSEDFLRIGNPNILSTRLHICISSPIHTRTHARNHINKYYCQCVINTHRCP